MNLKKTRFISMLLIGVFAVLMLVMGITQNAGYGYAAIAVMGIYGVFHFLFWRCPNCQKNMGPLYVKHCPNCGEKIKDI